MRCKKTVYIVYKCDHCGSYGLERAGTLFGLPYNKMPDNWMHLGKEYLCPTCAEIYKRVLEELKGEKHV